ncbi:hypothetical protein O4G98_11700 [Zoogloeaceae bacterium G21618-S1]|nr:hypothetical protein [Zoogloeaceae bacterium G21618-S1]
MMMTFGKFVRAVPHPVMLGFVLFASALIAQIPLTALIAVTVVTVFPHLAIAVLFGVVISALVFAW